MVDVNTASDLTTECIKNSSTRSSTSITKEQNATFTSTESSTAEHKLSKNQQKKLKKLELRKQHWKEKRKYERQRRKDRIKQTKLEGITLPPNRKQLRRMKQDKSSISIAIDSSFEQYMNDHDMKKLVKQIQHCYALNRRSSQPFQYYVTSFKGKIKDRILTLDGANWDIKYEAAHYSDVFDKLKLVYLSSESETLLHTLDPEKVYVIGGLVDHNNQKGLCHKLAVEKGISHAKLPISQYMDMKARKVLTIDHVFEILLKYNECNDWQEALYSVIPKRKGASLKCTTDSSSSQVPVQSETNDTS